MNEANHPLTEVDVKLLQRFSPEISGFIGMIKILFEEKNIDGINLMLRVVTASLQMFATEQIEAAERWLNDIQGNA